MFSKAGIITDTKALRGMPCLMPLAWLLVTVTHPWCALTYRSSFQSLPPLSNGQLVHIFLHLIFPREWVWHTVTHSYTSAALREACLSYYDRLITTSAVTQFYQSYDQIVHLRSI